MNFIKHLKGFFEIVGYDHRISAYHISLYMAIFQMWNNNRFNLEFSVNRSDLMERARIGSKSTYSKCIKELHEWGYIEYFPASNRHQSSKIKCTRFDTASETASGSSSGTTNGTANGTASGSLLINYINKKNYKNGEQNNSNFFNREKRKKIISKSPYHVNLDKDFSEPL